MKKLLFAAVMLFVAVMANAKDIKTVVLTTDPIMHCANCEAKIKENLKYCKGIKSIETNVADQTVTIQYDADKTSPDAFVQSLKKANYKATEKKACAKQSCSGEKNSCGKCKNGEEKACSAEKKSCDGKCKSQGEQKSCCKEGKKESCDGKCKSQGEQKSCCKEGKKVDATTGATKQSK